MELLTKNIIFNLKLDEKFYINEVFFYENIIFIVKEGWGEKVFSFININSK